MPPYRVQYDFGTYGQSDLELRKRLNDHDVPVFIRYWMQGRDPAWIGRDLGNVKGAALSSKMVRSHAIRLERAGFLPPGAGYAQPDWSEWHRPAGSDPAYDAPPVISADPRGPRSVQRGLVAGAAWRPNRGGRPSKAMTQPEGVALSPRQYPGLNWREASKRRQQDEAAESRQATLDAGARQRREAEEARALAARAIAELDDEGDDDGTERRRADPASKSQGAGRDPSAEHAPSEPAGRRRRASAKGQRRRASKPTGAGGPE